jgi:hypothetical protein
MLHLTSYVMMQPRFWRAAVVRAVIFVLFMNFNAPIIAFAAGLDFSATSGAVITSAIDIGASSNPTEGSMDGGLAQHAHCMCHSTVRAIFKTVPVRRSALDASLPFEADLQPRYALSSLPFKPPRSA